MRPCAQGRLFVARHHPVDSTGRCTGPIGPHAKCHAMHISLPFLLVSSSIHPPDHPIPGPACLLLLPSSCSWLSWPAPSSSRAGPPTRSLAIGIARRLPEHLSLHRFIARCSVVLVRFLGGFIRCVLAQDHCGLSPCVSCPGPGCMPPGRLNCTVGIFYRRSSHHRCKNLYPSFSSERACIRAYLRTVRTVLDRKIRCRAACRLISAPVLRFISSLCAPC